MAAILLLCMSTASVNAVVRSDLYWSQFPGAGLGVKINNGFLQVRINAFRGSRGIRR